MIHYTPLNLHDVFQLDAESSSTYQWIQKQNCSLLVKKSGDGEYEIVQVSSTEPQDYLNDDFKPGSTISF